MCHKEAKYASIALDGAHPALVVQGDDEIGARSQRPIIDFVNPTQKLRIYFQLHPQS